MWVFTAYLDIFQISIVGLIMETSGMKNMSAFKAMRTLRALRPLRAVSRWEGMRVSEVGIPSDVSLYI